MWILLLVLDKIIITQTKKGLLEFNLSSLSIKVSMKFLPILNKIHMSSGYFNSNPTKSKFTPSSPVNSKQKNKNLIISKSFSQDFTLNKDKTSTQSHQSQSQMKMIPQNSYHRIIKLEKEKIIRQCVRWDKRNVNRIKTGDKTWIRIKTNSVSVMSRIKNQHCNNKFNRFLIKTCKMCQKMMINLS